MVFPWTQWCRDLGYCVFALPLEAVPRSVVVEPELGAFVTGGGGVDGRVVVSGTTVRFSPGVPGTSFRSLTSHDDESGAQHEDRQAPNRC